MRDRNEGYYWILLTYMLEWSIAWFDSDDDIWWLNGMMVDYDDIRFIDETQIIKRS